jgi:transcriptional regulator with XRE-family HTH domain
MSQQDLADASGVSRVYVARLELGEQHPGWETVVKLAEALDVSTEAFREDAEAEPPMSQHPGRRLARKAAPPKSDRKKRK